MISKCISKEIEDDAKFWFEAEAKTLRPRPQCLEAECFAWKTVWPRGFNIIGQKRL